MLLALTTALLFTAAVLMKRTRWRFGSARGDGYRRCSLVAGLHEVGSYVEIQDLHSGRVLMHNLRALYWTNRLGTGPQYARSQGMFGFFCGYVGLRRRSARVFAQLAADPSAAEPGTRAITALRAGAASYLGHHDTNAAWITAAERYGQWLDLATYCDSLSVFLGDAVARGQVTEARRWLALGQRRLALHAGEPTALIFGEPMTYAISGRSLDAVAALRRAEARLPDPCPDTMAVMRQLARLVVLTEQNELGEPFDRAVGDFDALGVSPAALVRPHRVIHFQIAMGRLAQCRLPGGPTPPRLAAARAAVRTLGKACRSGELRARERIARADLMVTEGDARGALRVLDGDDPVLVPDAPLLAYERARVRVRSLLALGGVEESRRQARLAYGIAESNGWPHRVAWIGAEFGATSGQPRGAGTATGLPSAVAAGPEFSIPGPAHAAVELGYGRTALPSTASGLDRLRLKALEQVNAAVSRVLGPGDLARIALDQTIRILAAERAFLFLTDADGRLVPHLGRDTAGRDIDELTGYSASLVERVRLTRAPLVVTGTDEGEALGARSAVLHGLRSILVAPLQLDGRLLGVVYLDSHIAKGIFGADDVGILIALTNHIATSLETARAAQLEISVQAARRQRDLAELLRAALESMADTFEQREVLVRMLSWAAGRWPATVPG